MIARDLNVGRDIREWRKRNKYHTQADLQQELRIKSRGTVSAWENSDKPIPRILYLALMALEQRLGPREVFEKRMSAKERAAMKKRS